MFAFGAACKYVADAAERGALDCEGLETVINNAANLFSSDYKSYIILHAALIETWGLNRYKIGGITRA